MANKTLQQIKVTEISPNPHNPRLIFDPTELEELKASMSKVGILVPLTVYENTKDFPKTKYILLDGERRWRCALELGLNEVLANVIDEPTDVTQNLLFMFNIHHFRKEWPLFPTALKLEVLIEKLGTTQESTLSELTGLTKSTIKRCKTLLWFPDKYRGVLMEKGGKISTDFFIEIYPIVNRLSAEEEFSFPGGTIKLVDSFIDKFLRQDVVTDVKEFREIRKALGYYEASDDISSFKQLIDSFISKPNVGLEIFSSPDIDEGIAVKNLRKYLSFLSTSLDNINSNLLSDISLIDQLKIVEEKLRKLLERID